jgi:NCAIR mutase (PurE)-related protein
MKIKEILARVAEGSLDIDTAAASLEGTLDLGHTMLDLSRPQRNGFPEIIYGAGKTPQQLVDIVGHLRRHSNVLATRVSEEGAKAVLKEVPQAEYYQTGRALVCRDFPVTESGEVGIITAGTSDLPIAEEARISCEMLGCRPTLIQDVGVAGIHRLFKRLEEIRRMDVLIIIAGMEGALASVIGGLVAAPIIAVPTSAGYGASFGGVSALLGMLTSCASGVSVVNIDNGFGAACAAGRICSMRRK